MRKITTILGVFAFSFFLFSCGGKSIEDRIIDKINKEIEDGIRDGVENYDEDDYSNDSNDAGESIGDMYKNMPGIDSKVQKRIDVLSKMTPVTASDLKDYLPKESSEYKRTSFSSSGGGMFLATTMVEGGYANIQEEDKTFTYTIIDGSGEAGVALYGQYNLMLSLDVLEESEDHFKEVRTIDGYKMVVEQNDSRNTSSINYIEADRFVVQLEAYNMTYKELWAATRSIGFKDLKKLEK